MICCFLISYSAETPWIHLMYISSKGVRSHFDTHHVKMFSNVLQHSKSVAWNMFYNLPIRRHFWNVRHFESLVAIWNQTSKGWAPVLTASFTKRSIHTHGHSRRSTTGSPAEITTRNSTTWIAIQGPAFCWKWSCDNKMRGKMYKIRMSALLR